MVGQDLSEKSLNIVVASGSDDGSYEFDFDADFAVWIDFAFHTPSIAHEAQSARKSESLFALFCSEKSSLKRCLLMQESSMTEQLEGGDEASFDTRSRG